MKRLDSSFAYFLRRDDWISMSLRTSNRVTVNAEGCDELCKMFNLKTQSDENHLEIDTMTRYLKHVLGSGVEPFKIPATVAQVGKQFT